MSLVQLLCTGSDFVYVFVCIVVVCRTNPVDGLVLKLNFCALKHTCTVKYVLLQLWELEELSWWGATVIETSLHGTALLF